jgi:hypothetical protein
MERTRTSRRDTSGSHGEARKRKKRKSQRAGSTAELDADTLHTEQDITELSDDNDCTTSPATPPPKASTPTASSSDGGGSSSVGKPMGFMSFAAEDVLSSDDSSSMAQIQGKPVGFLSMLQTDAKKQPTLQHPSPHLKRAPSLLLAHHVSAARTVGTSAADTGKPVGFLSLLDTPDELVPVVQVPAAQPLQPLAIGRHVIEGKPAGFLSFTDSALPVSDASAGMPTSSSSSASSMSSSFGASDDASMVSDTLAVGRPLGFLSLVSEKEVKALVAEASKRPVRRSMRLMLSHTELRVGDTLRGKVILSSRMATTLSPTPSSPSLASASNTATRACRCLESISVVIRGSYLFDIVSAQCMCVCVCVCVGLLLLM